MIKCKAIIVINAEIQEKNKIVPISPATDKMVKALEKEIASQTIGKNQTEESIEIEVAPAVKLKSQHNESNPEKTTIYCPLTIEIPNYFVFPAQEIYQTCKDVSRLRTEVKERLGYRVDRETSLFGDLWLPIILTAKGPVYGEVIGEGAIPNSYQQPIHLNDRLRQSVYKLAYQLLNFLQATNSVYLLQFSCHGQEIIFDRLWPFPAAPALASLNKQQPNLYACYWYCLTNQPIPELIIKK